MEGKLAIYQYLMHSQHRNKVYNGSISKIRILSSVVPNFGMKVGHAL